MNLRKPNVLSVFDGISCGRVALERLGITPANYFASEIDKFAIKCNQANYPDTIQLGDVRGVGKALLEDYDIDILFAGSPCQGFSYAGKQLNFEDDRSKLFFEFIRIIKEVKPTYFLLENVRMKKEWQDLISFYVGVEPILINSSLVSAQNRQRLYWTNIPNVKQPEDRGIVLRDVLECGCVDREKSHCLDANYYKGTNLKQYFEKHRRQIVFVSDKCKQTKKSCANGDFKIGKIKELHQSKGDSQCQRIATADLKGHDSIKRVYSPNGKCPTLTNCQGGHREPKVICSAQADSKSNYEIDRRVYDSCGKSPTLMASRNRSEGIIKINCDEIEPYYRKLTPLECERLQTMPDGYTAMLSNTQRYKTLGNGWTVDVIAHILSYI